MLETLSMTITNVLIKPSCLYLEQYWVIYEWSLFTTVFQLFAGQFTEHEDMWNQSVTSDELNESQGNTVTRYYLEGMVMVHGPYSKCK